jgi:hypothetical protein
MKWLQDLTPKICGINSSYMDPGATKSWKPEAGAQNSQPCK